MREPKGLGRAHTAPNVTPLADVTMTLIIVFLIAMPSLMWSGMRVDARQVSETSSDVEAATTVPDDPEARVLLVTLTNEGFEIDGHAVADAAFARCVSEFVARSPRGTVAIEPDDTVVLERVVSALDVTKSSGAVKIALLDRTGTTARAAADETGRAGRPNGGRS